MISALLALSLLKFDYRVECDPSDQSSFPGVIAEVKVGKRNLRAYLLKYKSQETIALGAPTDAQLSDLSIRYLPNAACKLVSVQTRPTFASPDDLALKHSPYLILRSDQESHPDRDVPFQLGYSRFPHPDGGFDLRYTMYFSNETDNSPFATSKSKSMAMWGRRTDIEWIYEVSFNPNGKVVSRKYQGSVLLGIGHSTKNFHGKFLKGTQHPVLFDIARHNVFSDHAEPGQNLKSVAVHLGNPEEIPDPQAREDWMWRNPWSFDLSDRELRRTGELSHPSQDYLYVRLTGDIGGGKLAITSSEMTMDRITLTRLGEDLWNRTDYTAFRIHQFPTAAQALGKSIEFTASSRAVKIDEYQFLRLVPDPDQGFIAQDITDLFDCVRGICRY